MTSGIFLAKNQVTGRIYRNGITLIETLVVISIIGLLVALLIPAVQASREAARRSQCASNMRQLALSVVNYESANGVLPAQSLYPVHKPYPETGWSTSWIVALLPYFEQNTLYNAYNFAHEPVWTKASSNGLANSTVTCTQLAILSCPGDASGVRPRSPYATTNYMGNYGGPGQIAITSGLIVPTQNPLLDGDPDLPDKPPFPGIRGPIRPANVLDGLSNTALLSERLLGLPVKGLGVRRGDAADTNRVVFRTVHGAAVPADPRDGPIAARALVSECANLPGELKASGSVLNGQMWAAAYPLHLVVNSYTHVGPPNAVSCRNHLEWDGGDSLLIYVGPSGSAPPSSNHVGGVNVAFGDGSVRSIRDEIDLNTWWALGSRAGGEVVSGDDY